MVFDRMPSSSVCKILEMLEKYDEQLLEDLENQFEINYWKKRFDQIKEDSYVFEHLNPPEIIGLEKFCKLLKTKQNILEKTSRSLEICESCPNFASRGEFVLTLMEIGNKYCLKQGKLLLKVFFLTRQI